jgi:hypothetical protein
LGIKGDRHGRGSTIVTDQLPVAYTGTASSAIRPLPMPYFARLVRNSHRLILKGESPRKAAYRFQGVAFVKRVNAVMDGTSTSQPDGTWSNVVSSASV